MKRLPEHRLRRLLEPLSRIRLVAPARPAVATVAAAAVAGTLPEGAVVRSRGNELQVPAGELLVFPKVSILTARLSPHPSFSPDTHSHILFHSL